MTIAKIDKRKHAKEEFLHALREGYKLLSDEEYRAAAMAKLNGLLGDVREIRGATPLPPGVRQVQANRMPWQT